MNLWTFNVAQPIFDPKIEYQKMNVKLVEK